ncbi:MAG TPA: DUF362 domain-containing protein [Gemmataceae bacterium]|nr:DUF362 domain-containing protein [Gemmataceae bacterium]
MPDIVAHLDLLSAQAHAEGGWGYAPDQPAHLEPTCLALLALSLEADRYQMALAAGRQALSRCATRDGSYRLGRGRDEAVWPTALVLFVQAALSYPEDETRRTASRLLGLRGQVPPGTKTPDMIDIDFNLIGWPWAENNFSWAEPTAWACLALRRAGYGKHARVAQGLRLLLDRALDEGGINYGNRRIFGRLTEPLPGPTALMLLALQGQAAHPKVDAAVAYLQQHALAGDDLEHLCWAKIALDAYRDLPGVPATQAGLDERIIKAYHGRAATEWLRPAPLREALTALALAIDRKNYFCLNGSEIQAEPPPAASASAARRPWPERLKSAFRGLALQAAGRLRQPASPAAVHIAPAGDYNGDLAGTLQRQYEAFRARVPIAGKRVVLKPNLVEYHRDKVINTDPRVVAAAIELCRREGASEVIVAEGPGHCRNVEYLVSASGLGDVLRHYGVPFIDLNHDEPVKRPNLGRLTGLEDLFLARTVACADVLISLPKLKTHHWAGATLSLKNLFGTLPGICYGWPKNELHWRGIDKSIVDIALTRTPELAIVDGITGMEGDGPLNGSPRHLGALIMGTDALAVDASCCRLMQLDPQRIGYLVLGYQKKLGLLLEREIQQIGEKIEVLAQPFETLPHFQELYLGRPA